MANPILHRSILAKEFVKSLDYSQRNALRILYQKDSLQELAKELRHARGPHVPQGTGIPAKLLKECAEHIRVTTLPRRF